VTVIVAPERHVPHLLATRKPSHVLTMISPGAMAPFCPGLQPDRHLVLRFNDIAAPAEGLVAPSREAIRAILDFGAQWDRRAPLLIHCFAGISRSTAAAYILACDRAGFGQEARLAVELRRLSPMATPNALMIELADRLMKRNDLMVTAIAGIGRGRMASEGGIFDMIDQPENQSPTCV
jgi:predicted protein tyrosine phosphatase